MAPRSPRTATGNALAAASVATPCPLRRPVIRVCGKSITRACCAERSRWVIPAGVGQFKYCEQCRPEVERQAQLRKNASRQKRWRTDPEYRERSKALTRKSRYGITDAEYQELVAKCGGLCSICSAPPDPNGVRASSRLHVDHDHSTGAVRGLLCNRCNRGIGYFKDSKTLLLAAVAYLSDSAD